MRIPAAADRAIWGLVRGCLAAGGWQRRLAEAVYHALRPTPGPPAETLPGQLVLWVVDGEGLPPRPWRVLPDDVFDCVALGCRGMAVRTCVVRQLATDAQRTGQSSRGQGTEHPSCDTRKCAQGRGIRGALDPAAAVTWQGAGPGGRFARPRRQQEQDAARTRQERVGLLDPVRCLDVDPDPSAVED